MSETSIPLPRRFDTLDLDKSAGRVQILGGDFYYSPNCGRDVQLPAPHHTGSNPFSPPVLPHQRYNLWQIDTSTYEQPRWWCDCYGWIAFYNKYILDMPSTFLRIFKYSTTQYTFQEEDLGYTQPRWQAEEWHHLDRQLSDSTTELICHYRLPALPPCSPWAFGYLRPHPKRGILSLCLKKSKQWFGVWFGLLSYVIAESEAREVSLVEDPVLARHNWKNVLVAKCTAVQIDPAWVDLLLDTTVGSFSPFIWRTGTFLYITPGDAYQRENRFQPQVKWFTDYGVPVWYRWDKEAASLRENQYLAPLEFQLQQADSFLRKSPSPPPAPTPVDDNDSHPHRTERHFSTVQMDTFLKFRDERTARLKENETTQQRALRLSRETQPPTVNTRVFEWTANGAGEFVAEEITTKPRRKEVLNDYRGKQRRYNAVLNEWHVCVRWDHFEDSDDDDDDYDYVPAIFEGDPPDPPTSVQSYGGNSFFNDVWTPDQGGLEKEYCRALQLQEEILHVATLFFGYTARVPLPVVKIPILQTVPQRKKFCRDFGLIWDQVEPVERVLDYPAIAAVIDFFQRLASNVNMSPDEWDLSDKNQQSVLRSPRFKLFRPVFSLQTEKVSGKESPYTLYMLELGPEKAVAPWRLAMKSASDALMVCRLDPKFNEYDIVEFLLTNGIAFHTLQPSRTLSRTPDMPRPSLAPLTREEGYEFGSRDYIAYREHCDAILNHPRGRAALLHGNFMWRIAFRSVMWEAVYSGPSGLSADIDEMVVVRDPSTGIEFIDDKLSTAEQEAICGTYYCLTGEMYSESTPQSFTNCMLGNGKQGIKSWYMPPLMFHNSALNLGRWSTHIESSLFAVLDRTFTEQAQNSSIKRGPLSRSTWNDRARSSMDIKKARRRLEMAASKLFP